MCRINPDHAQLEPLRSAVSQASARPQAPDAREAGLRPDGVRTLHQPVLRLVRPLLKRGQASGAFNPDLPVDWMLTVLLELIHASSRKLATGRRPEDKAEPALIASITGALAPPAEGQGHREAVIAWLAAIPGFVRTPAGISRERRRAGQGAKGVGRAVVDEASSGAIRIDGHAADRVDCQPALRGISLADGGYELDWIADVAQGLAATESNRTWSSSEASAAVWPVNSTSPPVAADETRAARFTATLR